MRNWRESSKTVNEKVVCKLWWVVEIWGNVIVIVMRITFLDFNKIKDFRWQLRGSPTENCPGSCIPGKDLLHFLSLYPLLTCPSAYDPESSSLPDQASFHPQQPWQCGESAGFSTLLFALMSRSLVYLPALCSAGLWVPEGMEILTSVHAENLLLTPVLHFLKIHLRKPHKIFTAFPVYRSASNSIEVILSFLALYFKNCFK